jgi:hypothetical protein
MRETLYRDEDVHFLCDYVVNNTKVAMHLNITPGAWSPSKFKQYRGIFFQRVVPYLKDKKYGEVYATPFENDIKAQKLIKMFGLTEFDRKSGYVLMKREI